LLNRPDLELLAKIDRKKKASAIAGRSLISVALGLTQA